MLLTLYQTTAGNIALALQLVITYAVRDLLQEHTRQLKRIRSISLDAERSPNGDTGTLADRLEQMLERQLASIKTLILLDRCFKACFVDF